MFTGIIEELGAVESVESRAAGARLKIHCRKVLEDMAEGASIARERRVSHRGGIAAGFLLRRPGAGDPAPQQPGRAAAPSRA